MELWGIRLVTVLVLVIVFVAYLIYMKWRYQRQAENGVLCLIRNKAGRWRWKLKRLVEGFVDFPPPKDGMSGKTFAVDSDSAPHMDYPPGKWKFLQTTIPCVVLYEETWEPLSNISGRPVMSSRLLHVMRHEFWTGHSVRYSHEVEKKETEGEKKKGFSMSLVLWIVLGLALVGGCIWMWNENQGLKEAAGIGMDPVRLAMDLLGV